MQSPPPSGTIGTRPCPWRTCSTWPGPPTRGPRGSTTGGGGRSRGTSWSGSPCDLMDGAIPCPPPCSAVQNLPPTTHTPTCPGVIYLDSPSDASVDHTEARKHTLKGRPFSGKRPEASPLKFVWEDRTCRAPPWIQRGRKLTRSWADHPRAGIGRFPVTQNIPPRASVPHSVSDDRGLRSRSSPRS